MKCPECIKEGKKSVVYVGASTQTLAYAPASYDEEGRMIFRPNPNTNTTHYSCSQGHTWVETV